MEGVIAERKVDRTGVDTREVRGLIPPRPLGTIDRTAEVTFVLALHIAQMRLQPLPYRHGQHRPHVLLALAAAYDNLMPIAVDALNPEEYLD